jgi:hypothetical protein
MDYGCRVTGYRRVSGYRVGLKIGRKILPDFEKSFSNFKTVLMRKCLGQ